MPSETVLASKQATVAELTEKLKKAKSGVVVNYTGITVEDDTKLRAELRKANVDYKVFKNSITGRACEQAGYGEVAKHLTGMTAIAVSYTDEVAPAKVLKSYAEKIEKFEVKCGFVDGGYIDAAGVNALAEIPGKDVLVCKIMSGLQSSLYGLVYALQAIVDKSGEAPATEAAAE